MRYTRSAIALTFVCSAFMANSALAELLIDPTAKSKMGQKQISGYYATSTVTYEGDDGGTEDVDRTMLAATLAYGVSNSLDAYGTFAYIMKAEIEDIPKDDTGTAFAFGVRGKLPLQAATPIYGYAQLLMIDEDYGSSFSGKETAITAGAMASTMTDSVKLYGGIELVLNSDAEVKGPGGSGDGERDDTFGLRGGAVLASGDIDINFALALSHEKGFMIGATKGF